MCVRVLMRACAHACVYVQERVYVCKCECSFVKCGGVMFVAALGVVGREEMVCRLYEPPPAGQLAHTPSILRKELPAHLYAFVCVCVRSRACT